MSVPGRNLVEREGTSCENDSGMHVLIRRIRADVDAHYANRLLLAEANQCLTRCARQRGRVSHGVSRSAHATALHVRDRRHPAALAPLLENNLRRIELLHSILPSFPGTPIIQYGDEIGMRDNIYLGARRECLSCTKASTLLTPLPV